MQAAGKEDRKARERERKPSRCIEKGEGGKEDRKREERHSEKGSNRYTERKEGMEGERRKGRKEREGRKGWKMEGKEDE